ncbi:hypothetical protein BDF19DRAFT_432402 [Syncephalis fuscata]|nr:hypothetical protein BDF19DRAFT_432402 [Syncephalis fuscata]
MIVQEHVPSIDFLSFLIRMGPPAIIGTLVNTVCLLWYFRDRMGGGRLLPRRAAQRGRPRHAISSESITHLRAPSTTAVNTQTVDDLTIPFANTVGSYGAIGDFPVAPSLATSNMNSSGSSSISSNSNDDGDDDENVDEMEQRLFSGLSIDTEESSGDTDDDDDHEHDKQSTNEEETRRVNRLTSFSQLISLPGFSAMGDGDGIIDDNDDDLMDNETTRLLRSAQRHSTSYNGIRRMALQHADVLPSITNRTSEVVDVNPPLNQRPVQGAERCRPGVARRHSTGDSVSRLQQEARSRPGQMQDGWQSNVIDDSTPKFEWPAMPARHQASTSNNGMLNVNNQADNTRYSAPEISWTFMGTPSSRLVSPTHRLTSASRRHVSKMLKRIYKIIPKGGSKWLPSTENILFGIILSGMYIGFIYQMHLGFTCLTAGILMLLLKRTDPTRQLVDNVNYPLLTYLFGIFILIAGIRRTPLPDDLWRLFRPLVQNGHRVIEAIGLVSLTCALSFVFTSIPAVLLLAPRIPSMSPDWASTDGWLLLAWSVTLCGNWTPFGSVAGLVVSELCREYCEAAPGRGRWIGEFFVWWRFAWWSTCLVVITGAAVICFA